MDPSQKRSVMIGFNQNFQEYLLSEAKNLHTSKAILIKLKNLEIQLIILQLK